MLEEEKYTEEDVRRARSYLRTVETITFKILRIVTKATIRMPSVTVLAKQCEDSLIKCFSTIDNSKGITTYQTDISKLDLCFATAEQETEFTALLTAYFEEAKQLSNSMQLAYLLENVILFVNDVTRYVPAAYNGTEWHELKSHLDGLQKQIESTASEVSLDSAPLLKIYDTMRLKIMQLPKGYVPYPCCL